MSNIGGIGPEYSGYLRDQIDSKDYQRLGTRPIASASDEQMINRLLLLYILVLLLF